MKRRRVTTKADTAATPLPEVRPVLRAVVVTGIIALFVALVLASTWRQAPTIDEPVHILSGYTCLTSDDYRVNPEHPPLIKKLAAIPLLLDRPWPHDIARPAAEDERDASIEMTKMKRRWDLLLLQRSALQPMAHAFLYGFRDHVYERAGTTDIARISGEQAYSRKDFVNDAVSIVRRARIAPLAVALLLPLLVYFWARELFGFAGGVLAMLLVCLDPNFVAHAGLVTTDVGAATFIVGTAYFCWRTSRHFSWPNLAGIGIFLGLALLTKFSAILVAPLVVVLAFITARRSQPGLPSTFAARALLMVTVPALISLALIWAGYGFRYQAAGNPHAAAAEIAAIAQLTDAERAVTPRRLQSNPGSFALPEILRWDAAQRHLVEKGSEFSLDQARAEMPYVRIGGFGRTLLAIDRMKLLPEAYTFGLAFTRQSTIVRDSFLRGKYSIFGSPDYFLWTALFKLPLPILFFIAAGIVMARRADLRGDVVFLLLPVLVFGFTLATSNINIGHRHSLPLYPFFYIAAGAATLTWAAWARRRRLITAGIVVSILILTNLFVFAPPWRPQVAVGHHLAYFNELAGGPRNGYSKLLDSNVDWGQDIGRLAAWVSRSAPDEIINTNLFSIADPRSYGIRNRNLFLGYEFQFEEPFERAIRPGYLAISANNLQGVMYDETARARWREFLAGEELVARIGYSIFVFKLKPVSAPPAAGR